MERPILLLPKATTLPQGLFLAVPSRRQSDLKNCIFTLYRVEFACTDTAVAWSLKLQQVVCRCTGPVSRAPSGSSPTWRGAASAVLCVMQTKPSFYAACARANFLAESGRGFSDNPACGFLTMPDEFLPRVIKWIYNCGFVVVEQEEHIYRYLDFIIQVRSCDFKYV